MDNPTIKNVKNVNPKPNRTGLESKLQEHFLDP